MKKAKAKKAKNAKKNRGIKAKAKLAKEAKRAKWENKMARMTWIEQILRAFIALCTITYDETTRKNSYFDPMGVQLSEEEWRWIWDVCLIHKDDIIYGVPRKDLDRDDSKFLESDRKLFWSLMPHFVDCPCKRCTFVETLPDGSRLGIYPDGSRYKPVTFEKFRDLAHEIYGFCY